VENDVTGSTTSHFHACTASRAATPRAVRKSTINSEDELAEELAARFGVSRQAMLFRLINLGLVASPCAAVALGFGGADS
jgi:predicted Zn-dependent protease